MPRFREEVLNIALARLLGKRGMVSIPETIQTSRSGMRRLPDVLIVFRGLRVILEGKIEDQVNAESAAFDAAKTKTDEGIGHIGVAIVYPANLRNVSFDALETRLSETDLRFKIYNENGETDWMQGRIDLLASLLAQAHQQMIHEDVVAWGAEILGNAIEAAAKAFESVPAGTAIALNLLMERAEGFSNASEPEEP